MTKINKMVMHGFKSFAKHTELMFGGDFNCILGPNGSGKSNVLDALCFVLGKGSAKAMRAEKSSNLIYNGGKSKKQAKHGEVSIFFDNSNKKFPTDEKEIKVTRIVRQNGQSIYKINDKLRTRQQIIDLLNLAKIDPDGYNIILQGDIVRFVEMHPIERRMLIEDISGISAYEDKKHKAELEMEKVGKNLNDTGIILAERGTYLKELKKDRDQAIKFRDMATKVKESKASLLKLKIGKKEKEKKEMDEKIISTKEELDKTNEKIKQLKEENTQHKQKIEVLSKEIEERGEKGQLNLTKEVESLKIGLTKYNSRVEHLKNEIAKLQKRREELKNSMKEADNKISQLNKEKSELQKQKENRQKEKEGIIKKIEEFKKKNKLDSIGDIDRRIEEIDKKSEELQKETHSLREQEHSLIRKSDFLQHQINTIDESVKKIAAVEKEHKNEIDELKNKRESFKKHTLELNKCLDEASSLSAQLENSRKKFSDSQEELAKLRARDIGITEIKLADQAVRKILEQKNKVKGIYGTIAELGDVPAEYSLALEVAAGARIKSIVVEDDKVAADCISYLKKNKLGIATFLPLNKIKPKETKSELKQLAKAKGSHGLAIDLISYDNKFYDIFSYIFSNTIIVDDTETARKIGIGKARITTLDGDLFEHSGVMIGGYRKSKGYGFKEKELNKDIEEYEEITSNLKNIISTLEKRRIENDAKTAELREKKANLEADIIKIEKTLHLEPTDLSSSKLKKEELKTESADAGKEIEKVKEKITALNKELTGIKIEKQNLRQKISELRDPALVVELSTFEEKTKQIDGNIVEFVHEIRNINTQINEIYIPEKEKINAILRQMDKDELDFNKEINELKGIAKEKNSILSQKEEEAKKFYTQFRELFTEKSKIDSLTTKNEAIISQQLDKSREIELKNNTYSIKNVDIKAVLAGLQQEFSQYEGVKIDTNKTEDQLNYEISKYEKLKEEIGSVNLKALEIYEEVEKEYSSLLEKKEKLSNEKEDVVKMMQEIESKKKGLFMKEYNAITENFKRIFFQLSTKGGEAYLQLENPENPFEGGLNIKVKISSQKFMDIRSLSGGEKTMTALAFIFAIQEHEPASFYVLDEVDAALDKHNSEKFAKLIRQYADKAQYIIISHNDQVISESSNLYGISMDEHGMSKVVSLKI